MLIRSSPLTKISLVEMICYDIYIESKICHCRKLSLEYHISMFEVIIANTIKHARPLVHNVESSNKLLFMLLASTYTF